MKKRYFSIASSDFPQSVDHLYGKLKLCLFLKWVLNLVSWHAGMQEAMSLPSEEVSGCQMTSTGIQHESRYPDQRDNCNTHTHTTIFTALFPGLPGSAGARSNLLLDLRCKGDSRDLPTNNLAGRYSIRTNQWPTSLIRHVYAGCPSCHNPPNLSQLGTGTKWQYGDGTCKTVEENSSVFSLIRMC